MHAMQEHEMKPEPDYGLESYKGSGKLKNKVRNQMWVLECTVAVLTLRVLCRWP